MPRKIPFRRIMETLTASLMMLLLIGQSIAELENISIIPPGEEIVIEPEDIVMTRDERGFKPKVYARSNSNVFGGGKYSDEEQGLLLEAHNAYRKTVLPAASNMDELVWSPSLATLAQTWSDGCVYEHPKRNKHPEYKGKGQNLYIKYNDKNGKHPPKPTIQPVTLWNNEDKDYGYEIGSCNRGKVCGHYTQVVWAGTTEVGCGIKFCKEAITDSGVNFPNAWLVTCNYSPGGNFRGQKPYKAGSSCTACPHGFCKDGLCSDCDASEAGCECSLDCQNCGVLDKQSCTCQCQDGYYGIACEKTCKDKHRYCGAVPGWPKFWCHNSRLPFVDSYCPKMCGVCTAASGSLQC